MKENYGGVWFEQANEEPAQSMAAESNEDQLLVNVLNATGIRVGKNADIDIDKMMRVTIAAGSQCDEALNELHGRRVKRLHSALSSTPSVPSAVLVVHTLILIVPNLRWDIFDKNAGAYQREGLVLDSVGRIIVLSCPFDTELTSEQHARLLGRDGARPGKHEKVEVIDISGLLDVPTRALTSALRSCELMGLIARLAQGMPTSASINGGHAKLLDTPESAS